MGSGSEEIMEALLERIAPLAADTETPPSVRAAAKALASADGIVAVLQAALRLKVACDSAEIAAKRRSETATRALFAALDDSGAGITRTDTHTATIAAGARRARVSDPGRIPLRFWVTPEPEPDLKAITAALAAGEDVPGAEISNGAPHLSVRAVTTRKGKAAA